MKTRKAFAIIVIGIFLSALAEQSAFAATPIFDWNKTAFSGEAEWASDVTVDPVGNVVWGFWQTSSALNMNIYSVRKYSSAGVQAWNRYFNSVSGGPNGGGVVAHIASDSNGNIAVIHAGIGNYNGATYYWGGGFAKISATGEVLFSNGGNNGGNSPISWGYFAEPFKAAVAMDNAGNCIFAFPFTAFNYAGQSWNGNLDGDAGLLKLSPSGSFIWFKRILGTGLDVPTGVAIDAAGNVYVSGFADGAATFDATTLNSNGARDGFIAKYDKDGLLLWARRPFCSNADSIKSILLASDGTIWFGGDYIGSLTFGNTITTSGFSSYVGRIDSVGNPISVANLASVADVAKLAPSQSGRIVLTGRFTGNSTLGMTVANQGSDDVFVAEINAAGAAQWVKTLGYINLDYPGGVAVGNSGEVYVAANVNGGVVLGNQFIAGASSQDVVLAKLVDPSITQFPVVVSQPVGTSSYFGGQVGLSVQASSPVAITYKWFKDGVPIAGETSATLSFTSVRPSDDANYYVEITNQYGTVRSDSVHLIVRGDAPVVVTTLAGTNVVGFKDSITPGAARFYAPDSPAIQNDGIIVIPDAGNHAIRLLDPSGAVGTLSGKGVAGLDNGPASLATFNVPIGIAINSAWDIFVADGYNNVVRKISALGLRAVTTYAGTGEQGFQDGATAQAKFNFPNDLVCAPDGTLFVTEFQGHRVRKITTDGTVSTFAGTGVAGYQDGAGAQAQFNEPAGIARDTAGNLYVTEWLNHTIRKITPDGVVSTIAGNQGSSGFVDGPALTAARLYSPNGIAVDAKNNIFFTEWGNSSVRRLDPLGDVLTLVGTAGQGFRDGGRTDAQMWSPGGVAAHPDGSLIVTDTQNNAIRRVVWQTNPTPTEAAVLIELNPSITIFGIPGKTYTIQTSENLLSTNWITLGEATLQSAVETWFDTQPVTRTQRYYRAVLKN